MDKKNIPDILLYYLLLLKQSKNKNWYETATGTYLNKKIIKKQLKKAQKDKKRTPSVLLGLKLLVYQQNLKMLVRCWYV